MEMSTTIVTKAEAAICEIYPIVFLILYNAFYIWRIIFEKVNDPILKRNQITTEKERRCLKCTRIYLKLDQQGNIWNTTGIINDPKR